MVRVNFTSCDIASLLHIRNECAHKNVQRVEMFVIYRIQLQQRIRRWLKTTGV